MMPLVYERLRLTRWDAAAERSVLSPAAMLLLSVAGACLTGLLAQVRVPLPFTPVPFTGQVLAVLICGAFLGGGYGLLSQALYVGLGVAGLPWFSGGLAGMAVMAGPNGGYLVGFVVAAFFLGVCTRHFSGARSLQGQIGLMLMAVGIIYFFGLLHLILLLHVGLSTAVLLGAIPFVAADIVKAVIAALVTSAVLPKTDAEK